MYGLPTISFSPYGANSGPKIATSVMSTVITRPVTSLRWLADAPQVGRAQTLMTRSPSSLAG